MGHPAILLTQSGLDDLKEALGIQRVRVLTHGEVSTGKAMRGDTSCLFRVRRSEVTNLKPHHLDSKGL